ncbi:MAG: Xaa-Pro peptidase family protein [Spirochaetaceae bacterium]|jgi:Xaa-Pro dipeptidase|nr:Xaa-Pro peptidase family protein [Spirochaetaceae bacterium]
MSAYLDARLGRIYDWMAREGTALAMFEDSEGHRDPSIRWLTGHPGDALLFLSVDRKAALVPWDNNMAALYAEADAIIPYGEFERQPMKALKGIARYLKLPRGSKVEISPETSYTSFLRYIEEVSDYDILCRSGGVHEEVRQMRCVKDEEEIRIYREAAAITNDLMDQIEARVRQEKFRTETDVALFIEVESRKRGCEGTGFETLAAGPGRSFGIHAFPAYTDAPFASQGLSILDFGLRYQGYTTDVTMTFAREPSKPQERLLNLTERAYKLALTLVGEGISTRAVSVAVDELFTKNRKIMPHALGHGIGLETHEGPYLRSRADNTGSLGAGMIFTLEPGLYDPVHGGCRLENDVLVTGGGVEVLTSSRIVRL